jgi:phosphatidylinositol 4-kinase type 2
MSSMELTSDANLFLRENPWPDRYNTAFNTEVAPRKSRWTTMCLPGATGEELDEQNQAPQSSNPTQEPSPRFQWTEALQQNFREELEKLVILDYMMRNTGSSPLKYANVDRGLDNWMIKVCWHNHDNDETTQADGSAEADGKTNHSPQTKPAADQPMPSPALVDIRTSDTSTGSRVATPPPGTPITNAPHIHIGAIDNSLAFPWKHPDEWRSFPLYSPFLYRINVVAGFSSRYR